MRREYTLSNVAIALSLLRSGYAHACERCERGMHVRYASGLCVGCYNELREAARAPRVTRKVTRRVVRAELPAEATPQG